MAVHLSPQLWQFVPHLELLNRKIVETIEKGGRLIVEIPVRHGKSELCSYWLPLWFLERWPNKNVILASHEQAFSARFGRRVRNSVTDFKRSLDLRLSEDITSAKEWQTAQEGGMLSVGVGGSITGRGVNLLIIDDPIKNWDEAKSPQERERVWDWWLTTAKTRLEPDSAAIFVMARWHPDDLVGRLKSPEWNPPDEEDAPWEVLNLPALAEENDVMGRKPGQALWPSRWPKRKLEPISRGDNRVWNALYQQHPRTTEGNMFQKDWFKIYDKTPAGIKWIRCWDLASRKKSKQGSNPDYTVGVLMGMLDGEYWVEDVVRFRGTPKEVKDRVKSTALLDTRKVPIWFWQDPGQAGVDQADEYVRNLLRGYTVRFKKATESKETYADPVSSAAEAGLYHIKTRPWTKAYLDEFEDFPFGEHDDQIDPTSLGHFVLSSNKVTTLAAPGSSGRQENSWKVA